MVRPLLDNERPIEVLIGGSRYLDWESVEVFRPLDAATGSFRLTSKPGAGVRFPRRPGAEVVIRYLGRQLLSGFIDSAKGSIRRSGNSLVVTGRDRTSDLVDSVPARPLQFPVNSSILLAIARIADSFGIEVSNKSFPATLTKLPTFAMAPGEKGWDAIIRAAKSVGALLYTNGDGKLAIDEPSSRGRATVDLVEGQNLLKADFEVDHRDRYRTYIVRGQRSGGEVPAGLVLATPEGRAVDPFVERERTLVILADTGSDPETAKAQAQYQATRRAARAERITAKVASWLQGGNSGDLWTVNQLIGIRTGTIAVSTEMLVNRVRFKHSRGDGTMAELELVRPDSYTLEPPAPTVDPFAELFEE